MPESIVIRLPLLRKGNGVPRAPNNVVIDLRGVLGNKHTILCSTLVESQAAGLELVIEIAVASSTPQAVAQGSVAWKWAYHIDLEPLTATTHTRVTNTLLFPYMPFMAVAPNGGMPASALPGRIPYARVVDPVSRYEDRGVGTGGLLCEGGAAGQDNVASHGSGHFVAVPIRLPLRMASANGDTFVLVL